MGVPSRVDLLWLDTSSMDAPGRGAYPLNSREGVDFRLATTDSTLGHRRRFPSGHRRIHSHGQGYLGRVDDLDATYAAARLIINPTVVGTGLKIKTVEALCYLRTIVLWPSGVDGLARELRELCEIASDWFDFARRVIKLASTDDGTRALHDRRSELARHFAPDSVYAPLQGALVFA